MIKEFIDKIKKSMEPKKIVVFHYIIYFITMDGEKHEYSMIDYYERNPLDHYLSWHNDYLIDKEGTHFPMHTVVKIYAIADKYGTAEYSDYKYAYAEEDVSNAQQLD